MPPPIQKPRPKYLDLRRIKLPITGIVSIIHRISGVLLVLMLPFVIYLLDLSLRGVQGFAQVEQVFDHIMVKLLVLVGLVGFIHHFIAGIRFLLLDIDVGISLNQARIGAWMVVGVECLLIGMVMVWWL